LEKLIQKKLILKKKDKEDPKNIKSLKELYNNNPTIFVIIILLSGFNSNTFEVLQNKLKIRGVSYNVKFENKEFSDKLLTWTDHVEAFVKNIPEIVVQVFFF